LVGSIALKRDSITITAVPKPVLKHQHIIMEFPPEFNSIINIGCGECAFDLFLKHDVPEINLISIDIQQPATLSMEQISYLDFRVGDILDISTIPVRGDVVIASEVLEHIADWKSAFRNLLELFNKTLILTIPWRKSYNSPGHINFWDDTCSDGIMAIDTFVIVMKQYLSSASNVTLKWKFKKILTKEEDREMQQRCYLITITKEHICDK